jgi:biotin synthase
MKSSCVCHPAVEEAYAVLATGTPIEPPLAARLAKLSGASVPDLISLAHKVQLKYAAGVHACSIVNAKSGACPENCRFCAQSAHHAAQVPEYGLLDPEELLAKAEAVWRSGVRRFGIVTSGTGCTGGEHAELNSVIETIGLINQRLPGMEVCASLGALDDAAAQALAAAGVSHYNLNLQVATGRYRELISDTHTAADRLAALATLKRNGIELCCGGIIGVGETMADRVALAFELRELGVGTIPLNVLIPIPGTPLAGSAPVPAVEVAATFAIFRLVHPRAVIKFAAGRETVMKDFQALLMLAGANGLLTGGYLTTRGRETSEDAALLAELARFGDDGDAGRHLPR